MGLATSISAIAQAAQTWQDPEYPARQAAEEATLDASNTFTEEALAFAVNQQMHLLTPEALAAWVEGRQAATPQTVGVLNAGNVPLVGLQDFLAVILVGHRYLGTVSSKSPVLLPAFADEVRRHDPTLDAAFVEADTLFDQADALIATGRDETKAWVAERCDEASIPPARRLLRGSGFSIAVLDGQESADERERLAEDALLHEGYGCRNVALIWAPDGLSPDAYLDAFAAFRGVFPAHPSTSGSLKMQQAFLDAVDAPHAYGDGLEFLLSKGEPEVQRPGHVRWVPYHTLDEVRAWLDAHAASVQVVVARRRHAEALGTRVLPFGEAQRPALDWCPDGADTMAFLAAL